MGVLLLCERLRCVTDTLAVLTLGGDAAGMNAPVCAVVRSGLDAGFDVFAVSESDVVPNNTHFDTTRTSVEYLIEQEGEEIPESAFVGLQKGDIRFTPLVEFPELIESGVRRTRVQVWMALRPVAGALVRPDPRNTQR